MQAALKTCGNCQRVFLKDEDFLKFTTRWRKCSEGNLWVNCECGSTLLLPKGKYDWYAPEKRLSPEASSVFNDLSHKKHIPHLDTQVMRIHEILSRNDFQLGELADAIKSDPLIASNVLTVANAFKSHGVKKIDSIKHAIVYIGKEPLQEIVLIAGLRKFKISTSTFMIEDFWNETISAGINAEFIVRKIAPHIIPDEVYISACLANIGKLLTAILYPKEADRISEKMYESDPPKNWHLMEQEFKTPKHTILGEIAVTLWGLPQYVSEIVSDHHNCNRLFWGKGKAGITKLDVVALSIQMTHLMNIEPALAQADIIEKFKKYFQLSEQDFHKFFEEVKNNHRHKRSQLIW